MQSKTSSIKKIRTSWLAETKNYRDHLFIAINNLEANLLDEKTAVLKKLVA